MARWGFPAAIFLAWLLGARGAAAEPDPDTLDARMPVRAGWGYSRLFHAPVLSLSEEGEFSVHKLSDTANLQVLFGIDGQRGPEIPLPPGTPTLHYGFLGVTFGGGLLLRSRDGGPAAILGASISPLWESSSDDLLFHGIGIGGRIEFYPFYETLRQCVECRHGTFVTYVLEGLSVWALGRQDWLGPTSGTSYALGAGVDLARDVLLPILGAVFDGACAKRD